MAKRAALGRGLGALLGNPAAINEIPIDRIVPNPYQPRATFDPEALEELASPSAVSVSSSR